MKTKNHTNVDGCEQPHDPDPERVASLVLAVCVVGLPAVDHREP